MTLAMNSTVISGTPRHELDEDDRAELDHRQLRAPAEREHDAERQRGDHADDGDHQSDQETAPELRLDVRHSEIEGEQEEQQHRKIRR